MRARVDWADRIRGRWRRTASSCYPQPILDLPPAQVRQHELLLRMRGEDGE